MTHRVYEAGNLVEEWDDEARIYRRFANGVAVEQRAYTAAEYAKMPKHQRTTMVPVRDHPRALPGDTVLSSAPLDLGFGGKKSVVLAPSLAWENGVVQEPAVWHANGAWHMLYTGGWESAAIGYATTTDPLGVWAKHPVAVIGNGAGGMATPTAHHSVYVEDDTVYAYHPSHIDGGHLKVATAAVSQPTVFTTRGTALAMTPTATGYANSCVVKRGEGDYVLMVDGLASTGAMWQGGVAVATSPLGPFTMLRWPLPSLSRGDATSIYGGFHLMRQGTTWVLYYHASTSGVLPTDGYRSTSSDLLSWVPSPAEAIIRRTMPEEFDQVADLNLAANPAGGPHYAFWSGMDNVTPKGFVLATVPTVATVQFDGSRWVRIT